MQKTTELTISKMRTHAFISQYEDVLLPYIAFYAPKKPQNKKKKKPNSAMIAAKKISNIRTINIKQLTASKFLTGEQLWITSNPAAKLSIRATRKCPSWQAELAGRVKQAIRVRKSSL